MAVLDPKSLLAPEDFRAHWREDQSDDEYHRTTNAVGSSSLRLILKSPKAFHARVIQGLKQEETEALRLGRVIHMAILEGNKFREKYVVMPEFTGRTKTGTLTNSSSCTEVKEKKTAWLMDQPPGAIVVTEDERDMIIGMAESFLAHPHCDVVMGQGKAEIAGYFRDQETGLRLKVKPDFYSFDGTRLNDIKSCKSSEWRDFGASTFSFRYDVQLFMYAEGIRQITGKFPDFINLIAIEKTPPYECAIYAFTTNDLQQAETDYRKSLRKLKRAITENRWPQRQAGIQTIYTPQWFINQALESEGYEV